MLGEIEALRAKISSLEHEMAHLRAENEYLRERMVAFQEATARASECAEYMGAGEERAYGRILPHDAQSPAKEVRGGKKKKDM
jgi:regulator of replication initiation timing